jgi:hypothetical protein
MASFSPPDDYAGIVSLEFSSLEEAIEATKQYAERVGFKVRIRSNSRLTCSNAGHRLTPSISLRRREKSERTDCKFKARVGSNGYNMYRVCVDEPLHNHELSIPPRTARLLEKNSVLSNEYIGLVLQLRRAGIKYADVLQELRRRDPRASVLRVYDIKNVVKKQSGVWSKFMKTTAEIDCHTSEWQLSSDPNEDAEISGHKAATGQAASHPMVTRALSREGGKSRGQSMREGDFNSASR